MFFRWAGITAGPFIKRLAGPESRRRAWTAWLMVWVALLALLALVGPAIAAQSQELQLETERITGLDLSQLDWSRVVVSADLKTTAFVKTDGGWERLVVGDRPQREYGHIGAVSFTGESRKVVYAARSSGKWVLVTGDKESRQKFDAITEIVTGAKSDSVAYTGRRENRWVVMKNSSQLGEYEGVEHLAMSPDGEIVAFAAMRGKKWYCVKFTRGDSKMDETGYAEIGAIAICPVCKGVGYTARDGREWSIVLMDAKKGEDRVKSTPFESIGRLVLNPAGKDFGYAATRGDRWRVVGPRGEGKPHDEIGEIAFSLDGGKITYSARDGDEWKVVVDDTESEGYIRILGGGGPRFADGESRVLFAALKGDEPYRVQAVIKPASVVTSPPDNPSGAVRGPCPGCSCPGLGSAHQCRCGPHMGCMR
ncbi:MAG: hypothetical protein Q7T82_11970 [Armatimonadota bacterium]|nr:hypothetical protein [Armatimonadota bacterium]